MFEQLEALVRASGKLQLVLKADGDRMSVVVVPHGDSKESALRQPLVLSGTAAELDDGFADAIGKYSVAHASLSEQVAVTTAILQEAEKGQASKAQKSLNRTTKAPSKSTAPDGNDGDEEEDDPGSGAASPTAPAAIAPATEKSAGTDLLSLLNGA